MNKYKKLFYEICNDHQFFPYLLGSKMKRTVILNDGSTHHLNIGNHILVPSTSYQFCYDSDPGPRLFCVGAYLYYINDENFDILNNIDLNSDNYNDLKIKLEHTNLTTDLYNYHCFTHGVYFDKYNNVNYFLDEIIEYFWQTSFTYAPIITLRSDGFKCEGFAGSLLTHGLLNINNLLELNFDSMTNMFDKVVLK